MSWTTEEIQRALDLYATGISWRKVGSEIGRTKSATLCAVKRHLGHIPERRDRGVSGPAIGLEPSETAYRKDCKLGSMILREACLDLFCRTANRHNTSMDDAMARHLGLHSPPKLIRAPYKTQSAMRSLAA
jgi:hypothetical protein